MTQPSDPQVEHTQASAAPPPASYPQAPPPPADAYGRPAAAVVPTGMYYDQASGLTLPQGVVLASVGRRIGAWFMGLLLFIVTLGIGWLVWGAIVWARGQTPALQVLRMRCYRPETGRVPGWWWMALREIVGRIVEDILGIITEAVSLVLMCARQDRKSLHDLIAGTVVLHDPENSLANWPR
jgi:uncharacterized RDD family membrane protein YckC